MLASHSLPDEAYTLAAVATDPLGGCWALECSHSDVPGSHEQLWRITRTEMRRVGEFGSVDFNTNAGNYVQGLAIGAQGAWVGVMSTNGDTEDTAQRELRCYDRNGHLVKQLWGNIHVLGDDRMGNVWLRDSNEVRRVDSPGTSGGLIGPDMARHGVYQSVWFVR